MLTQNQNKLSGNIFLNEALKNARQHKNPVTNSVSPVKQNEGIVAFSRNFHSNDGEYVAHNKGKRDSSNTGESDLLSNGIVSSHSSPVIVKRLKLSELKLLAHTRGLNAKKVADNLQAKNELSKKMCYVDTLVFIADKLHTMMKEKSVESLFLRQTLDTLELVLKINKTSDAGESSP